MDEIKKQLELTGQSHLLQFWNHLADQEQDLFLQQLTCIDFKQVNNYFHAALESLTDDIKKLDDRMKPIPKSQFGSVQTSSADTLKNYYNIGLRKIAKGEVGVLLMAGGQGTRLGSTNPKGMFSVGIPSKKTLFQIQAERILRLEQLAEDFTGQDNKITWYIMTSGPTMAPTKAFLSENNFFGLDPANVVLFEQGLIPCFDLEGKIFLDEKHKLALAPDGNGGIYRALLERGVLDDMDKRGVKYLHAYSVDNILVKVADPTFIGYCVEKAADCGAKVVQKNNPHEAVGVVCQVDGLYQVVEYSEITDKTAELRDETGNLVFNAGNIANHFFTTAFLKKVATEYETKIKLHVAKKKIPYVNDAGVKVKPDTPNGIKIEKFIFDVFQFTNKFVTWEVPRESEFSALKNADSAGKDCPSTSRRDLSNLHRSYITAMGGQIVGEDAVEISPLLSYQGEGLTDLVQGKTFISPVYFLSEREINTADDGVSIIQN